LAQKTSWNAAALTESDINTYLTGEGGSWTSWTPLITQSGNVSRTATRAVYGRWGRLIVFQAYMSVTGTGSAGFTISVSLPVTAASGLAIPIGDGFLFDASSGNYYGFHTRIATTTTVDLQGDGIGADLALGGATFTAALASGDVISISGIYEAAS
jgi:hypothetical protein